MDEKTLKTLEFDKIREMLARHAVNDEAKDRAMTIVPSAELALVETALADTDGAVVMILKQKKPSRI